MNRSAYDHRFLISGHLFLTPGNSNFFLFPLKVRVIGIRLYIIAYGKPRNSKQMLHRLKKRNAALQTFIQNSPVPALQVSLPSVSSVSYPQVPPASSSLALDPVTLSIHTKYGIPGQSCRDWLNFIDNSKKCLKYGACEGDLGASRPALSTIKRLDCANEEL